MATETSRVCEQRVLKALKSRTQSLSLNNSNLQALPVAIGRLDFLISLSAKNNGLQSLPSQIENLTSLCYLNLGSNELEESSLSHLLSFSNLTTLHLFKNRIQVLSDKFCKALHRLKFLNLNENFLTNLPAEISLLKELENFSISNNLLRSLPPEIGAMQRLEELHLDGNALSTLPDTIGNIVNLKKLLLQKNKLQRLPDNLGHCKRLCVLDVSSNKLEVFPSNFVSLMLREFYFESNPLFPSVPVPAEQYEDVLQLKELASRVIVEELKLNVHILRRIEMVYPDLGKALCNAGRCSLCGKPFIHTWLQCVQFKPIREVFPLLVSVTPGADYHIPLKAALCSYKCFNSEGHSFFGIAE